MEQGRVGRGVGIGVGRVCLIPLLLPSSVAGLGLLSESFSLADSRRVEKIATSNQFPIILPPNLFNNSSLPYRLSHSLPLRVYAPCPFTFVLVRFSGDRRQTQVFNLPYMTTISI